MTEPIRTFSGAHPYRPQCVATAATANLAQIMPTDVAANLAIQCTVRITTAISNGVCPRCSDSLWPAALPDGWRPAGTRALPCRCVPVCETCASWIEPISGAVAVTAWPTDECELDDGRIRKDVEMESVTKARAAAQSALLHSGPDGQVLVTQLGVAQIESRPHPGGWLEYGYDDDPDRREREA